MSSDIIKLAYFKLHIKKSLTYVIVLLPRGYSGARVALKRIPPAPTIIFVGHRRNASTQSCHKFDCKRRKSNLTNYRTELNHMFK